MKIYEIGTGYTPIPAQMGAATEIVVEELTKALLKQDIPVQILDIAAEGRAKTTLPIREVKVPKQFSGTDVQLGIMHKLKRVVYSVALAGELKKILKGADDNVVLHFHNQYNLFFFLKLVPKTLREKCRIAYTVHSYIWPDEWEKIKDTVKKRYFQEIYCVQNADCVLVLNDKTAEHFVNYLGVDAARIHKVGNGVNTDVYRVLTQDEIAPFQASEGLSGKQLIFQVGSVCDRKNQLGAVKMLREYLQNNPDVVYAYAGGVIDSDYQDSITHYARENNIAHQVHYVGELCPGEPLNRYYNAAQLTVFPSRIESFGLVIIESLSAGTPVILADKPLFTLESGYHLYHSETEFVDQITACITCGKQSDQVRSEVVQKYSWDTIAAEHMGIWTEVSGR